MTGQEISHSSKESLEEPVLATLPSVQTFEGTVFGWFETGLEGMTWALQDKRSEGYDGLVVLKKDDEIIITSPIGEELFNGRIDPDQEIGRNGLRQPQALGYWIHWTQSGWQPDEWAKLFLEEKNIGKLIRTEG